MTKRKLTQQEKLLQLRALENDRRVLERKIRDAVAMCRQTNIYGTPDCTWSEVGDALGVTRQAVMQKYADGVLRRAEASTRKQPAAKRRGASA